MRQPSHWVCGFILSVMFLAAPALRGEPPPDPLRLVPSSQADLILKVDKPRRLVETVLGLDALKQLQKLQAVREISDSTNSRRFLQLVAYFEKELGVKWPEMLDRLAGGGAVVAVKFGPEPPAAGVIIQGRDAELLRKFVRTAAIVMDQELARQESPGRLEKSKYRDLETFHIGKEFHAAAAGAALVFANSKERLQKLIDHHLDGKKGMERAPRLAEARKLLPPDPLAWAWLNFDPVHNAPQAKDIFAQPRNDPNLTVVIGGWLDVARRSPFGCAALTVDQGRVVTTIRLPRGREGMPPELAVHIPPSDAAGALPLLEPRGVLYSTSYYLDLSKFWEYRAKLFNEAVAKSFEEADKKSAPFLLGNRLNKLLTQAGSHLRIVATFQPRESYAAGPLGFYSYLAYGLTLDMRDPKFGKSLETLLRGGALLARTQVKLKLVKEQHGDVTIIGYRFETDENTPKAVVNDGLMAYYPSPSFAVVGNQFVGASTVELCRELVDLVRQEAATSSAADRPASVRTRLYGESGAELLHGIEDILSTQAVLGQALAPTEAREQVRLLIDWVRGLGTFAMEGRYGDRDYRFDLIYSPKTQEP
jgi:hypothetical protein